MMYMMLIIPAHGYPGVDVGDVIRNIHKGIQTLDHQIAQYLLHLTMQSVGYPSSSFDVRVSHLTVAQTSGWP